MIEETCFMMSRDQGKAVHALMGERAYQEQKWPGHTHSTLEYLVYMRDYIEEALRVQSRQPDEKAHEFSLHTVRKIGAMALAAMEQNGVRHREQEGPRPVGYVEIMVCAKCGEVTCDC